MDYSILMIYYHHSLLTKVFIQIFLLFVHKNCRQIAFYTGPTGNYSWIFLALKHKWKWHSQNKSSSWRRQNLEITTKPRNLFSLLVGNKDAETMPVSLNIVHEDNIKFKKKNLDIIWQWQRFFHLLQRVWFNIAIR